MFVSPICHYNLHSRRYSVTFKASNQLIAHCLKHGEILRCMYWFDFFQNCCLFLLCVIHIPPHLKVHPEVSRHIEKLSQPQCCAWCHTSTSMDNIINALIGNVDRVG